MRHKPLYWVLRTSLDGTTFWTNNIENCYWHIVYEKSGLYAVYDYRGTDNIYGARIIYSKSLSRCKQLIRKFYNQINQLREVENAV